MLSHQAGAELPAHAGIAAGQQHRAGDTAAISRGAMRLDISGVHLPAEHPCEGVAFAARWFPGAFNG